MKPNPWKTTSSKEKYSNSWIQVIEDQVVNPSGAPGIYGKVLFKNIALAILALDESMNTWLVGQWRYPLNEYSWELPMGGGLINVDRLESAKRELREETGITANQWEEIIKIHTSNCVTDEVGYGYIARELDFGPSEFDETEELEIRKLPFSKVVDMAMSNEITDSLSVATILKADKILSH